MTMHYDMLELFAMIEKSGPYPSQVVFGLLGERNAGSQAGMDKAEAAGNVMRHGIVQELDMMRKGLAYVRSDPSEVRHRVA